MLILDDAKLVPEADRFTQQSQDVKFVDVCARIKCVRVMSPKVSKNEIEVGRALLLWAKSMIATL